MAAEGASAAGNWLSSAAPFIASGVDSLAGLLGMSGSAHYQRRNMREAARLQHEENLFWAEYNSPANQMSRLRDAGLNPNLVYGNGADAQFSGSVSPSGAAPEFKGSPGTDFITFSRLMSEKENIDADSALKREQAREKAMENEEREASNPKEMGKIQNQMAWSNLEKNGNEAQKINAEMQLAMAQRDLVNMDLSIKYEYGIDMAEAQLKSLDIQNEIADLNLKNTPRQLQAQYDLTRAQSRELCALIAQHNAQVAQLNQLTENLKVERQNLIKQGKNIEKQGENIDYDTKLKQAQGMAARLEAIGIKIRNIFKDATLPVDVINSYLSPANVTANALGGFGIPIKANAAILTGMAQKNANLYSAPNPYSNPFNP